MIVGWIVAGLLLVLSAVLLSGHGSFLIAGYNTSTKEQQARYDRKKLCRAVGSMLLAVAAFTVLLLLFFSEVLLIVYFAVMIASVIALNVYIHKKCRSGVPEQEIPEGKSSDKLAAILGTAIGAVVLTAIIISFSVNSKPPVYTLKNGSLIISTAFGQTVRLSDIQSVALKNDVPDIGTKLNGLGLGSILKGRFSTGAGDAMLYVDTSKPPFIYIKTANETIILNDSTKAKTQNLYSELRADTGN